MNFGIFVLSEILFAIALLGFNLVTARADWESTLAAAKKRRQGSGDYGRDRYLA